MENAILIAKIAGIFYIAIGLGILFNPNLIKNAMEGFAKNMGLTLITGRILLVLGMLMVLSHNVWQRNRTLLITIIGWIVLIEGCTSLMFPNKFMKIGEKMVRKVNTFIIIFTLVLGIALIYFGFFA